MSSARMAGRTVSVTTSFELRKTPSPIVVARGYTRASAQFTTPQPSLWLSKYGVDVIVDAAVHTAMTFAAAVEQHTLARRADEC